jgi:2-polyprenyl-3-methyl-5-hydroxy-6-metoxy-1,4-benzoquinol methylase
MSDESLTWEQAVAWLRAQPKQQDLVEACYYDLPIINAAQRFEQSEEWLAVKKLLASCLPGKVLDIGAGNGVSSFSFAKAGCAVTAIEPDLSSTVGLEAIKTLTESHNLNIQAIQAQGEAIPFPNDTFDIVYGRQVLHHARNLKQLCVEASRVLKPGGIFIATREHVISSEKDLSLFLENHPLHALYGGENAFLLRDYCQGIKETGLQFKLILGPYDSEINYAPTTSSQNRALIQKKLDRFIGKSASNILIRSSTFYQMINQIRSWQCGTPGRLYSFLATKPEML